MFLPCAAGSRGCGKVGILRLDFHFSIDLVVLLARFLVDRERSSRRSGGNVGISPLLRDFQGAVGSWENLLLVFQAFHGSAISTARSAVLA